jgi:hypothetical protein
MHSHAERGNERAQQHPEAPDSWAGLLIAFVPAISTGRVFDLSALVFGDEPLLGAVPMEMMDLVLNPATQRLSVNPASPYLPVALAK